MRAKAPDDSSEPLGKRVGFFLRYRPPQIKAGKPFENRHDLLWAVSAHFRSANVNTLERYHTIRCAGSPRAEGCAHPWSRLPVRSVVKRFDKGPARA